VGKQDPSFELKFLESIVNERPNYIDALIPLAEAYTKSGRYEQGLEIDQRLSKLCLDDPVIHYNLACSLALVGQKDQAIHTLKKAVFLGFRDKQHIQKDKDLVCLHGHPDFGQLLQELD